MQFLSTSQIEKEVLHVLYKAAPNDLPIAPMVKPITQLIELLLSNYRCEIKESMRAMSARIDDEKIASGWLQASSHI